MLVNACGCVSIILFRFVSFSLLFAHLFRISSVASSCLLSRLSLVSLVCFSLSLSLLLCFVFLLFLFARLLRLSLSLVPLLLFLIDSSLLCTGVLSLGFFLLFSSSFSLLMCFPFVLIFDHLQSVSGGACCGGWV